MDSHNVAATTPDIVPGVLLAYAKLDEPLALELEGHLKPFELLGKLTLTLLERDALPGMNRSSERLQLFDNASLTVLLLSSDYIGSALYAGEIERAIGRSRRGLATVVPVLARSCVLDPTGLRREECLPTTGEPIADRPSHDAAWAQISKEIVRILAHETVTRKPTQHPALGTEPQAAPGVSGPVTPSVVSKTRPGSPPQPVRRHLTVSRLRQLIRLPRQGWLGLAVALAITATAGVGMHLDVPAKLRQGPQTNSQVKEPSCPDLGHLSADQSQACAQIKETISAYLQDCSRMRKLNMAHPSSLAGTLLFSINKQGLATPQQPQIPGCGEPGDEQFRISPFQIPGLEHGDFSVTYPYSVPAS